MDNPFVSTIIPAFNSQKTIAQTIQATLNQTYKNMEVVVVDDGSTDRTAEIVKSFSSVKYFYQKNLGPASARNRGAKEAKGKILFFTDSDCVPHADWISTALKGFENTSVAVVAGSYGIANQESLLSRCIHQEIVFRHSCLMPEYIKVFGSYNFAVVKNIFDRVGGFNIQYPHASGEDNDLSYKILKTGNKILFNRLSLVDHYHTQSILKYLKEQFRHGFWRVKMYQEHPKMLAGDGYTFWKDMVEVPLSYLFVGLTIATLFFPLHVFFAWQAVFWSMVILELFFSFKINVTLLEKLFFGCVMFLRALSRAAGFFWGALNFLVKIK